MSRFGGGAKCGMCQKTVYMAEEVVALGEKWHKMCFKCKSCQRGLDSSTVAENKGQLYCTSCHGRLFGIQGHGYGGGAGTLASEGNGSYGGGGSNSYGVTGGSYGGGAGPPGTTQASPGSGGPKFASRNECPRCHKTVYIAEMIRAAGSAWHKGCFSCKDCNKKLDSTTVADKDGEIYCKSCFGKSFGPKGFGFGQGEGALLSTGKSSNCRRCQKQFQQGDEQEEAFGALWHKRCFRCEECSTILMEDSAKQDEGNPMEFYCKHCFLLLFK